MTPHLRDLYTKRNNALEMMNMQADRARIVAGSAVTFDEKIAADVDYQKAIKASYEAELAYQAAVTEYAGGEGV